MSKTLIGHLLSYFLILQLLFLAAGAFYGGIAMISDPSGNLLGMTVYQLEKSPFQNYLWPGLILLLSMGILPLCAIIGLINGNRNRKTRCYWIYSHMHYGWALSLFSGIGLIIWMIMQIIYIGYESPIQAFFAFFGILILITTLMPTMMKKYQRL